LKASVIVVEDKQKSLRLRHRRTSQWPTCLYLLAI